VAFGKKKEAGPGPLESYDVTYKGGLAHLPKSKVGKIVWEIWDDHFQFEPSNATKKFWEPLTIPYEEISDLAVVGRQVSTFEALAGGLNSKQLNQDNNINIAYGSPGGPVVLRLEMLSGVTVVGQAKKCLEMLDRLRAHQIVAKFGGRATEGGAPTAARPTFRPRSRLWLSCTLRASCRPRSSSQRSPNSSAGCETQIVPLRQTAAAAGFRRDGVSTRWAKGPNTSPIAPQRITCARIE
jgi:hypothetical protein